jgi:hypothetical protein
VLVNPDIEEWFNKLQGKRLGAGGSAPRGTPQNYAAAAAEGIVKPGPGMFGFSAPAIEGGRFQPRPPAPNPGERAPSGGNLPFEGIPGGGANLGGGAKTAGLQKMGQGILEGLQALQAKRLAQQKAQAEVAASRQPLGVSAARNPGASMPATSPYSPASIGAASETPLLAQGAEGAEPVPPIGGGGALPTLAQHSSSGGPGPIVGNIAAARYNNPGDVSLPISGWNGPGQIVGLKGQPGYASFPDMKTGLDALGHRLTNYIDSKGLNTIGALNSSYAKDQNWAAGVARASGLGINTPLDTSNQEQMRALQKGILSQEIGANNANSVLGGAPAPITSPSAAAYAAAPPSTQPEAPAVAGPTPSNGQPEVQHGTYNGQDYTYQPSGAPQPPLLNGGLPGVYSMPGQQGMNDQANPLAAALAQGNQPQPQLDQSALLALALGGNQPDFGDLSGLFS